LADHRIEAASLTGAPDVGLDLVKHSAAVFPQPRRGGARFGHCEIGKREHLGVDQR